MQDDGSDEQRSSLRELVQRMHRAAWGMRSEDGVLGVLSEVRRGLAEAGVRVDSCVLYATGGSESTAVRCCEVSGHGRWQELQEPATCGRVADLQRVYCAQRVWDTVVDLLLADRCVLAERLGHRVESLLEAPFSHGAIGLYDSQPCAFGSWEEEVLEHLSLALSVLFQRMEDLASLRATERQLRHVQRLQLVGQLTAEVAHEISNPITVILGGCDLLLERALDPDVAAGLNAISNAGMQAKLVGERLLDFVRGHRAEKEWVNLNRLVQESLLLLGRMLWKEGIELREDLAGNLPWVEAHAGQLQQVVLNLVQNSRDALRGHRIQGVIRVSTRVADGRVLLEVEDNGPGIPAEIRDRVFEPFFTTKDSGHSSGLGLSVCSGIAKEHGGALRLEPRVLGTCMVLELPVRQAPVSGSN